MHHPTDRIAHTTAFVTPVVEHWLEREIGQWVHPMKDRSDDPTHHERTLLPRSYISLLYIINETGFSYVWLSQNYSNYGKLSKVILERLKDRNMMFITRVNYLITESSKILLTWKPTCYCKNFFFLNKNKTPNI